MSDVDTHLRRIERNPAPDLWSEIEQRARSPHRTPVPPDRHRGPAAVLAVIVTIALVALLTLAVHPFRRSIAPAAGAGTGDLLVSYRADITSQSSQVWSAHSDGSGGHAFIADGRSIYDESAVWSPDGARVAFLRSSRDGGGGIWVMNADGTQARQLAADLRVARGLDWSPDGTSIAFASTGSSDGTSSAQSVYLVNVESGTVTTLASGDYLGPSFSPDGRQIAMLQGFNGPGDNTALAIVNADGSNLHRITPVTGRYWSVAWDPTGEWIATQWTAPGHSSVDTELWLLRPDGSARTRLTHRLGWDGAPVWSPDGSRLAFDSDRCAGRQQVRKWVARGEGPWRTCVYVMNADGTDAHLVFKRGTFQTTPTSWRATG